MNENIDLTKILKDCPKGWEFYSSILGEVELEGICDDDKQEFSIIVKSCNYDYTDSFTKEGFYYVNKGECTLFPSKDQRDWNKFTAPWYKKLVEPKFKVGDKIVNSLRKYMGALGSQGVISEITDNKYIFTDSSYIYISNQDSWELVSNKKPKFDPETLKPFSMILARFSKTGIWYCDFFSFIEKDGVNLIKGCGAYYKHCIPYNDETKHLVGTTDEAPEYYRYWED